MISKLDEVANVVFGDTGKLAIAGVFGALVRWATLRNDWKEGLSALVVGGICAVYLGPFVEPLLAPALGSVVPDGDTSGFASFVVGLGGISISGLLIDLINARRSKVNEEIQNTESD